MGLTGCFEKWVQNQENQDDDNGLAVSDLATARTAAAMVKITAIKFTSTQECMTVAAMFRHIAFVGIVA